MRHSPGATTVRVDRPGGVSASVFRRFRPRRSLLRRGFSFGPEVAGLPGRMSVGRQLERTAGLRSARTNGAADVDGANGADGTARAVRRSGSRPESFWKKDRNASAASAKRFRSDQWGLERVTSRCGMLRARAAGRRRRPRRRGRSPAAAPAPRRRGPAARSRAGRSRRRSPARSSS